MALSFEDIAVSNLDIYQQFKKNFFRTLSACLNHWTRFYRVKHRKSKKCPYSELLWSVFYRILTEYGPEKLRTLTLFTQLELLLSFLYFRQAMVVHYGCETFHKVTSENTYALQLILWERFRLRVILIL